MATMNKSEVFKEAMESLICLRNDYLFRGGFYCFVTKKNHRVKINRKDVQFIREIYHESCEFDIAGRPNQTAKSIIIFFSNASEPIEFSTSRGHENYISESCLSELSAALTYDNEILP